MATNLKVTYTPEDSIPGNNKGTLSWTSDLATVRVYNSATKQMQDLPGKGKLELNVTAPAKGTQTYTYTFFNGNQQKPIYTHSVRVSSQPLLFASWKPTYPFDKNAGDRNGYGTATLKTRGVVKVKLFGIDLDLPNMLPGKSYSVPANVPGSIATPLRENGKTELAISLPVTDANGQERNLKINLIVG